MKEALKAFLEDRFEILDLGTYGTEPVDYPDYAEKLGLAIIEKRAERGILLCSSGVGACATIRIQLIKALSMTI